jgi:hypothetical protein
MENPWKRWAASTLPPPRQDGIIIIDSGIREDHPWLRSLVTRGANFTNEDFKDHCGHGTSMALMAVAVSPFPPKLISVKVAEADGRGSSDALIRALEWIAHYQRANTQTLVTANFSVGVFSQSLLPGGCKGMCAVCRTAIATAATGVSDRRHDHRRRRQHSRQNSLPRDSRPRSRTQHSRRRLDKPSERYRPNPCQRLIWDLSTDAMAKTENPRLAG